MVKSLIAVVGVLTLSLVVVAVSCAPAAEATPKEFYKGKTVTIVFPAEAGSSGDIMTRAIAPYLSEATGAKFAVVNKPGGAGIDGINEVMLAEPDGLTLGGAYQYAVFTLNDILDTPGIEWECDKIKYIGGMSWEPHVFLVKPGGYDSIAKLKAGKDLVLGGFSPRGNYSLGSLTVVDALGLDAKVLFGYKSTGDIALDIAKEELAGCVMSSAACLKRMPLGVAPLFVLASERTTIFPDVPTLLEAVIASGGDKDEIARAKEWAAIWDGIISSKAVYTAPGVSGDRLAFLRSAFNQVAANPQFIKELEKLFKYEPFECKSGEELEQRAIAIKGRKAELGKIFLGMIEKYRK